MCGILFFEGQYCQDEMKIISRKMKHRGPDGSGYHLSTAGYSFFHERLAIVDLSSGSQPFVTNKGTALIHNGEIYNHRELRVSYLSSVEWSSTSDSEVIVHLYEKFGKKICSMLDGVFAFVIADGATIFAARDPVGVKPLYFGKDRFGKIIIGSEMKSMQELCESFEEFPPGHYYHSQYGFKCWYQPRWLSQPQMHEETNRLRSTLTRAVEKRLMSDVPVGVFLSGGLDSSLVASIMSRSLPGKKLKTFSVGFSSDSPDLLAAREVADFLGSDHHEVLLPIEAGLACIKKAVWHLETYDITTIRAGIPMMLLSEYIVKQGIRVVLSGEGADEIFGGYLYFHQAPSAEEFHVETIRRVFRLHTADVLRVDRATMSHGLEARVPFLDKSFLETAMSLDPKLKVPSQYQGQLEKMILRLAFDTPKPYLPKHLLYRQKEQFSDGVGYSWIDKIKEYCEQQVSEELYQKRNELFPYQTPDSKEAFYMRQLFEEFFAQKDSIKQVKKWVPKWQKNKDPSGRASEIHVSQQGKLVKAC